MGVLVLAVLAVDVVTVADRRGGDPQPTPAELVASAADAARRAGTSAFELVVTTAVGDQETTVTATGVQELGGTRSTLRYIFPQPDGTSVPIDALTDGTMLYLRVPIDRLPATQGKPWIATDVSRFAPQGPGGQGPEQLAYLEGLARLGNQVEDLGREEVRSEPTTHLRVDARLDRLVEVVPVGFRSSLEAIGAAGVETVPIEAWIGDDGLPRRVRTELTVSAASSVSVLELFDFGAELDVAVPSPEETFVQEDVTTAVTMLVR